MESPWIRLAFLLGLSQGVAWTFLCLACIIVRNTPFNKLFFEPGIGKVKGFIPFSYLVNMLMWYLNLDPLNETMDDDLTPYYSYMGLKSKEEFYLQSNTPFYAFVWIMFFLSIMWAVLSIQMFRDDYYMKYWSVCTGVIWCVDFILMILVGANFASCIDGVRKLQEPMIGRDHDFAHDEVVFHGHPREILCASGILPVLIIAGRGFTLWIINLIMCVIIWNLRNEDEEEVGMAQPNLS